MDAATLISGVGSWAALRTSVRWEKSVASQLHEAGVPVFLPLVNRVTHSKYKRQVSEVPLFPGYVFCSITDFTGNSKVLPSCRHKIAQILRTPDSSQLKEELFTIARLLDERQIVHERCSGLVGETVRITGGPLGGYLGEIVRLKPGTSRIVLQISFLGARVEASVEERDLEKVAPNSRPRAGTGRMPYGRSLAG